MFVIITGYRNQSKMYTEIIDIVVAILITSFLIVMKCNVNIATFPGDVMRNGIFRWSFYLAIVLGIVMILWSWIRNIWLSKNRGVDLQAIADVPITISQGAPNCDVVPVIRMSTGQAIDPDHESKFIRYWGRILRAEMSYPSSRNKATQMAALYKLDKLWAEHVPTLRKIDKARYMHRVVAFSLVPSISEIRSAEIMHSEGNSERLYDLVNPVIENRSWWNFGQLKRANQKMDF